MTLSTQLWSENSDLASEALTHPFVCRLGDGSLAREIFAGYLASQERCKSSDIDSAHLRL